jgi:hypothetical protein
VVDAVVRRAEEEKQKQRQEAYLRMQEHMSDRTSKFMEHQQHVRGADSPPCDLSD